MVDNNNLKTVNVLGVKIHDVSLNEAADIVESWLKKEGKHYIVTPNPEFIMAAQTDKEFRDILNSADLSIPDGVGLKLFSDLESTSPGIDLMEMLIKRSNEKGATVGFLGGKDGVAEKTAECLLQKYPNLKISYISSGGNIGGDGNPQEVVSSKYYVSREEVKQSKNPHNTQYIIPNTDLLFVAFGQVKQEKWMAKNLPKIPVKVVMGVGGAFDYLSGKVPRATKWIRSLGLEWLFRLIIQPWRIRRQLNLFKFIWLIIKSRLTR